MIDFRGRWIVLDVEGTTSSITFVHEVLFPFARRRVAEFLTLHGNDPEVRAACDQIARDDGIAPSIPGAALVEHVHRLIDEDRKATGLKQLQGLIWREGYAAGLLRSHVYPDVPTALNRWRSAGRRLAVYSSGSIEAQKQFFSHTDFGDLLPNFSAHFDTTTGPKREADSYRRIAAALEAPPNEVLFLSDVPAEIDAAHAAGLPVGLVIRDPAAENASTVHPVIRDFDAVP